LALRKPMLFDYAGGVPSPVIAHPPHPQAAPIQYLCKVSAMVHPSTHNCYPLRAIKHTRHI
jgi:hypothetical protein